METGDWLSGTVKGHQGHDLFSYFFCLGVSELTKWQQNLQVSLSQMAISKSRMRKLNLFFFRGSKESVFLNIFDSIGFFLLKLFPSFILLELFLLPGSHNIRSYSSF